MAKAREFTTLPVRAIADTRLTALDLRCLAVIALHDGMSLIRGTGAGCYARSSTLAELAHTDISNFSKSLSRLIKFDYVVREPQQNDRRRFTHRVIYSGENSWRADQLSQAGSDAELVGEFTNNHPETVGEFTNQLPEIVGDGESGNGSFLRDSGPQYIPLNGEIDFVETSEINSVETARRENFAPRCDDDFIDLTGASGMKKNAAEAGCASGVSIDALLKRQVPSFPSLAQRNVDAALSHFEKAFAAINRNADDLDPRERKRWSDWLLALTDECIETSAGNRAYRLYEEFAGWEAPDAVPAEISIDDLRAWARAAVDALGYGGQQKLADAAGVPASYVSRFRNGKSLPERYQQDLVRACDRTIPFTSWSAAA